MECCCNRQAKDEFFFISGWKMRYDEILSDESTIREISGRFQFNSESFIDSSWADCKTTRTSTSSGCIFLNGALVMNVCRTQASVALSSCEAELCAANDLMVERIYLFRLCKFVEMETVTSAMRK